MSLSIEQVSQLCKFITRSPQPHFKTQDITSCAPLPLSGLILDMFSPLISCDSDHNCTENKEILSGKHNKFGDDDEQLSTNNDSRY